MSNTELNRQIVQEGLERKHTARLQRMIDEANDAAERQLRDEINRHAMARRTMIELEEADKRRLEEASRQMAAVRAQKAADRAQEEKEVKRTLRLTALVFGSLLYASLVTFGYIHEAINMGAAMTAIGLAATYSIATFIKYATRITRARREA